MFTFLHQARYSMNLGLCRFSDLTEARFYRVLLHKGAERNGI